jgi:thymidine kinase
MSNATLEVILGPMFSGKSSELIRRVRICKSINRKNLVIKPKIDNRYESNKVCSHDKVSEDCLVLKDLSELFLNKSNLDSLIESSIVFIEEGQFFKDLVDYVLKLVEEFNKDVVIIGLDGDYNRKPFGEILNLIPYANKIVKLNSMCKVCNDGTLAPFTFLKNNNIIKNQILVGGSNLYIPVCRKHYLELNNTVIDRTDSIQCQEI